MTTEKEVIELAARYFMKELGDLSIDEECVGCCKVVDVAAGLQKELDEYKETVYLERIDHRTTLKTVNQYSQTKIKELKDNNIEDLHELYDLYEKELGWLKRVVSARDLTIKSLTSMCQSSGNERNKLASTIDDLNTQLTEKRAIINEITRLRVDEVETRQGLEDELSALEQDSEVLMKVVDAITMWNRSPIEPRRTISDIRIVVNNYLDAPGGPPETSVDEPQEIIITCAWLELP